MHKTITFALPPSMLQAMGYTTIAGLVVLALWLVTPAQQHIVTLDVEVLINAFVAKNTKANLSSDALNQQVDNFTIKLEKIVNKEAVKHNYIVLPKQAVIAGSIDITNNIKHQVLD